MSADLRLLRRLSCVDRVPRPLEQHGGRIILLRPQLLFGDQALNELRSILLVGLDPFV